jgi:hypothetical protein
LVNDTETKNGDINMKNITEQEINGKLKEQLDKDKPLDYIDFLTFFLT